MKEHFHKYLAEGLGTFGVVFFAAGAVLANGASGGLGVTGVALASGLGFVAMFYATHHLSGAHLNPAVTVGLWATGHIKTLVGLGYIVAQLIGSIIAALFLKLIFTSASPAYSLGNVSVASNVSPGIAILAEAILTFFFVYVYFSAGAHKRAQASVREDRESAEAAHKKGEHNHHAGIALGFLWAVAIFVGWNLTGGALNPARALGPALIANNWTMHYVYWVGPLLGGLIAAFVYHFGYMKQKSS